MHIPVNQLTITNERTLTINGNYGSTSSVSPAPTAEPITESLRTSLDQSTAHDAEPTSDTGPATSITMSIGGVARPPQGPGESVGNTGTLSTDRGSGGDLPEPSDKPGFTQVSPQPTQAAGITGSPVEASSPPSAPVVTPVTSTIANQGQSGFGVGSQTFAPGSPAITIGTEVPSLASSASALVINGQSTRLAPASVTSNTDDDNDVLAHYILSAIGGSDEQAAPPQAAVILGSSTYAQDSHSNIVIGTQTLVPGGPPITAGGTVLSLGTSTPAVMINGQASSLAHPQELSGPPAVMSLGSLLVTQNAASVFVFGSQTLSPGGGAITVDGSTLSLATSATAVVVNGQSSVLPLATAVETIAPVITVGQSTITEGTMSRFVIGPQTLVPGAAAITIGTDVVSLNPAADSVVINGQTFSVVTPTPTLEGEPERIITIGSTAFTEIGGSKFVIGTQTLYAGGSPITVDGTVLSLATGGSSVVIDGQTSALGSVGTVSAPVATATGDGAKYSVPELVGAGWLLLLVACLRYLI